jgi:Tol biopolymer transport system component
MAYNATPPGKPNSILLRDLSRATNRFLDDKDSSLGFGVSPSISPDGSKVVFERDCKTRAGVPGADIFSCGFVVSAAGGQSEQVCEFCTPRGFSSNGSVVLIQKYATSDNGKDRIVALDLATKAEREFLSLPDKNLYHAFFSWDDRWVVFKKLLEPSRVQLVIAPVRNGVAGKEVEWIAVTDGRYSDDKPQFSPDGNTVYFTSTRDGYLCIWAQRLDPRTKRPLGDPVAYEHFHNSVGRDASDPHTQLNSDLSVARDKMLINLPEARHDLWMMQIE